jgi:hypothetical protein
MSFQELGERIDLGRIESDYILEVVYLVTKEETNQRLER